MPSLKVFLFGQFEVYVNGQGITSRLWQSRQVRQIFKLLIAMRGKPVTSDQIIDIIWPGLDPETAQNNLYVRISQLRKLLKQEKGRELIQTIEGGYLFVPHPDEENHTSEICWIDADEFERAADEGRALLEGKKIKPAIQMLESAKNLYRGDYLSEDLYQEWTLGERERLRDRNLMVLTELAEAYAQNGLYRRAINICRQILTIEPCREAVFLRLMLYYYFSGEKAKALQVYRQCKQALHDELDVVPDQYTRKIAKQIEEGSLWLQEGIPHYPPPAFEGRLFEVPYSLGNPPFSGRAREYAWLVNQWRTNPQSVLWIEGEAGVGKTRLIEEFVGYAASQGAQVIKLRGLPSPNTPYAAWINVLQEFPHELNLNELNHRTRRVLQAFLTKSNGSENTGSLVDDPSKQMEHIKAALSDLIKMKGRNGRLFVVDDAHLLDLPSLEVLSELIGNSPLLIICRTEDTPADHPLRCLFEEKTQSNSLQLNRLSEVDIGQLLAHLSSRQMPILASQLNSITQGNPLFLIATLQHLFEQGILFVNSKGEWEQSDSIDSTISPSIQQTISARLQTLQPENRRILDMLAVAGGSSNYELLHCALKAEESVLLTQVDYLIEHGFLVEPRDVVSAEVEVAHACYREVVYQTLPKARRRIYHRQYGEAMLAIGMNSPFDAAVLAHHFRHGEIKEKAVQYAKIGGDYALRVYAPKQALKHFQDALDWLELPDGGEPTEPAAQIWMGMAEALRLSGEYQQAFVYYQRAMPHLQDEIKQAAVYQAFQLQIRQGMPLSTYEKWAAEHEHAIAEEGDSWTLALFYWARSFVALLRGMKTETIVQNANGWRVSRRLMAAGREPPFWVHQRALSLFMLAHNQWSNYQTSIHYADRLLKLTGDKARDEDANTIAAVEAAMGESCYHLGQYQRAQELFLGCLELAVKASDPRLQGDALIGLGWIYYERGDLATAESYARRVLDLVDRENDIPRLVKAHLLQGQIAISRLAIQETLPALENFLQLARFQEAAPYTARILLMLAEAYLLIDQAGQAEVHAREAADLSDGCGMKRVHCTALRLWAEGKSQQHDREEGLRLAHAAVDLAEKIQTPYEIGLSLRSRGRNQNDPEKCIQDIERALALFEKIGAEIEVRRTRDMMVRLITDSQV